MVEKVVNKKVKSKIQINDIEFYHIDCLHREGKPAAWLWHLYNEKEFWIDGKLYACARGGFLEFLEDGNYSPTLPRIELSKYKRIQNIIEKIGHIEL